MSATMHSVNVTFTVPDGKHLPPGTDDEHVHGFIRSAIIVEINRLYRLHPMIFACPPDVL